MASSSSQSSPELSAPTSMNNHTSQSIYKNSTHEEVLEDLSSRFLLNLPEGELSSLERVCFQVEQAHWFYEDFIREQNPAFPSLPLKKFSEMLFSACPLLHQWSHDHEFAFDNFMQYKTRVPVCGAIMLNDRWDKCVLVKGWKSSAGWGFPKGKINEGEEPHACAIREVLEETGYNLAGQLNPAHVLKMTIREQSISLYIVPNVPEDYHFETRTRKEISRIEWFKLADLPTWKRNKTVAGKFYLISPFISGLRQFIHDHKPRNGRRGKKNIPHATNSHPDDSYDTIVPDSDGPALESSSQSSHDNGGPETPSPLYSQPVPNIVDPAVPVQEDVRQALPTGGIDPHIARIMNALTLSTSGANKNKVSLSDIPVQPSHRLPTSSSQPPTVHAIPTPNNNNKDDSKEVSSAALINNSNPLYNAYPLASSSPSQGSIVSHQTHSSLLKTPTTAPSILQRGTTPGPLPQAANAPSHSPETRSVKISNPPEAHVQPTQRKVSRRSSSAVIDVSPYLSRPAETPASAKQMKQLALLETIADESERTAHNNLMKQSPVNPLAMNGHLIHGRQPYLPPASVPPLPFGGAGPGVPIANDLLYSSGLRQPFDPRGNMTNPLVPPPRPPSSAYDDPFQVRPRTSQTFRPIPAPRPPVLGPLVQPPQHHPSVTPFPPGHPAGAPQNPLLTMLNTPVPGPAGLAVYGAPNVPPQGSQPPYPMHPGMPPAHGMMNGQMARSPAMPMVPPASAPAVSPLFPNTQPRPASRAHLLSLLNNPVPM